MKAQPFFCRYLTHIVNGLFVLYLVGCGLMLFDLTRSNPGEDFWLLGIALFCVGSFVRFLLALLIGLLGLAYCAIQPTKE